MSSPSNSHPAGRGVALVVGVIVAMVTCAHLDESRPTLAAISGTGTPRADCVGVAVTSSQEKSALLAQLASEYDGGKPKEGGRCVDVRVNTLASGAAEKLLARGWSTTSDGPQPVVWTPAATSWLSLLRFERMSGDRPGPDLVPADPPRLVQSPLVLAMPRPMAEALGWPNAPVGWAEILKLAQDPQGWGRYGHPEWGRFQLGKTSPLDSTSGLHSLLAAYYAATGVSADLTSADVANPRVTSFVRGVEASVLHYGDTVSTFLDGLSSADGRGAAMSYVSAVATEETQVLAYNGKKPATPLVAVYPKDGTLVADHPFAVLNAPWVTDEQRQAAVSFGRWLLQPARQSRFWSAGFRDHDGRLEAARGVADGVIPAGPPLVLKPPAPTVLAMVRNSWGGVRKRARALLVLDVSGSMEGDKMDQVRKAAAAALTLFADDDQVGLWTFSSGIEEVSPIENLGPNRAFLSFAIRGLQAGGNTVLYQVTRRAEEAIHTGWDPSRINAVILLTDGQNEDADKDLEGLLRTLKNTQQERPAPVFTIAYGSDADLPTLKRIAEASHGRAYNAPDPGHITAVFTAVVSNF